MTEKSAGSKAVWIDPDDAPELTDEILDRAEFAIGDRVIRPATGTLTKAGRPRLEKPKAQITLRLDQDVIAKFRAGGPGWQSRINEVLRKAKA